MRGSVNKQVFSTAEELQPLLAEARSPNRTKLIIDEFSPVYLNDMLIYTEDMFLKELETFMNYSRLKLVDLDIDTIGPFPDCIKDYGEGEASVNVATFMRIDFLAACLKSIVEKRPGIDFNLIVMCQDPQPHMRKFLKDLQELGPVKVIIHEENIDGAQRKQELADACPSERFVLLDDDMEALTDDWLLNLKKGLDYHPRTVVSHAMLYHSRYSRFTHGGGYIMDVPPDKKFKFMNTFFRNLDGLPAIMPVNWVASAGGMIKQSIYEEIPYDIKYMGFGDFDWSLRLAGAGYGMVSVRDAVVLHNNAKRNTEYEKVVTHSFKVKVTTNKSRRHFLKKWEHIEKGWAI